MYCSKCGKQLNDDDAFCSGCGQPTSVSTGQAPYQGQPTAADSYISQPNASDSYNNQTSSVPPYNQQAPSAQEDSTLAIIAIVISFFLPAVGIILALVGHTNYKTKKNKNLCKIAIVINLIIIIALLVFACVFFNSFAMLWEGLESCQGMS
jgi:uncharacterized membrane protein YvbJ